MNIAPVSPDLYTAALELVEEGDLNALKHLLTHYAIDPNTNESEFLRLAIVHNRAEIFAYLLPFYNKKFDNSDVLCEACSLNHTDFVLQLIAHTDPTVNQSEPLMWAARHNNIRLMDLLLPVSNVFDAIELVNKHAPEAQDPQTQCHKGLGYLNHWLTNLLQTGKKDGRKKI